MRVVSDPQDLEEAWREQYERLAAKIGSILPDKRGVLVEIGCGKGQLTIPLARKVSDYRIVALDNFRGSYSGHRVELSDAISHSEMKKRIKPVVSDYLAWLRWQAASKYDVIISSEFLSEIDAEGVHRFFAECYRVLRGSGVTVHSFLSPVARNQRQRRLIDADSNPRWTKTPPLEWFSPPENLVVSHLRWVGFRNIGQFRLKSGLIFRSDAAEELLRRWEVGRSYWKSHQKTLEEVGLEIPDWSIIAGSKS